MCELGRAFSAVGEVDKYITGVSEAHSVYGGYEFLMKC